MTGRMDYRPNVEGAKWFAEKVFPLVLAKYLPRDSISLVPNRPIPEGSDERNDNPTGSVEDISPLYFARHGLWWRRYTKRVEFKIKS